MNKKVVPLICRESDMWTFHILFTCILSYSYFILQGPKGDGGNKGERVNCIYILIILTLKYLCLLQHTLHLTYVCFLVVI